MWHIYADKNDSDMGGNIPMTYYTAEKKREEGVVRGTKKRNIVKQN